MKINNQKGNIVIIVAVLILAIGILVGALLFRSFHRETAEQNQQVAAVDPQVKQLGTQSDSDEVEAIDKDVNATNLDNLDRELPAEEKEIGGI